MQQSCKLNALIKPKAKAAVQENKNMEAYPGGEMLEANSHLLIDNSTVCLY